MSLRWNNVDLNIPNKNKSINAKYLNLLKKCSGEIACGEIFAIMGPSGGGKTTLLNALFGKIPEGTISSGEILYKNKERDLYNWIKVAGFVDQDDVVNEDFTVEQSLRFAASLRLDRKKCLKEYKNKSFSEIVEIKLKKVIKLLKLEKCYANEMIKVSGGERKRVMIGIELISEPDVLLLDEPTSGLDANTALSLINLLKDMAVSEKKIVIVTIHQPSLEIFNSFNGVLFLTNGKSIYNGKISEVDDFLLKSNISKKEGITTPELLLKMCEDQEFIGEDNNKYNISNNYVEDENSIPRKDNDTYFRKSLDLYSIWVLIKREILIISKKKWEFFKSLLGYIIINILLLILFYLFYLSNSGPKEEPIDISGTNAAENTEHKITMEKINAYKKVAYDFYKYAMLNLYMIVTYILQMRLSASTFMNRWQIMKREVAVASYSITSVYISFFLIQMVIATIISSFMMLSFYFITPKFFGAIFISTSLLMNFIAISIGLFVASTFTRTFTTILFQSIFSIFISFRFDYLRYCMKRIIVLVTGNESYLLSLGHYDKLLWIFYLLPSLHHFNLLACQIFIPIRDMLKDKSILHYEQINNAFYGLQIDTILDSVRESIFLFEVTTLKILIFVIITTIPFLLFGFYFLGLNLSPSVRMKLEKKVK